MSSICFVIINLVVIKYIAKYPVCMHVDSLSRIEILRHKINFIILRENLNFVKSNKLNLIHLQYLSAL